jgi:DNA topoisomerase-3
MGKTLVIAEKPSVAGDIARALGKFEKKEDYYENENFLICSALGHLLELCLPEGVEPARGKWSLTNLPVIPKAFDLRPQTKTEPRLKLLMKLMKRKDVESLINACDAGREGELIFKYITQYAKCKLPSKRLWLQSMTANAIREGFESLRGEAEMSPLGNAAVCRSEADWLVGINGTRAMTAFNSRGGGFQKTTVGRVQTPTLTMIVEREEKIRAFKARPYYELHAVFGCQAGEYEGVWTDLNFKKDPDNKDLKPERLWDQKQAEAIRAECLGKTGTVTEESKKKTELSPLLFDLTSLQREANQRFGFSARRTLQLAQALYEKHKVLTYPRTDSRALPEDYIKTVRSTLKSLEETGFSSFAGKILANNWVRPTKRIFDNSKISDHFAIIPTGQIKTLSGDEARIYDFVVKRFLAVFYPAAEYLVTSRLTHIDKHAFKSEGKVMLSAGWTEVYGRETGDGKTPDLVQVRPGEQVRNKTIKIKTCETKPPARFTEATLLSAMESAGKLVEDEELRDAMKEKGLGTPATRASIIEGLLAEDYMQRKEKELVPTVKAFDLITLLRGLKLPELCSPELTGDWEFKLKQIEHQQLSRDEFMDMIRQMTRDIVDKVRGFGDEIPMTADPIEAPCPKCGGKVLEEYRRYRCESCDFALWKTVAGRRMEADEISRLLKDGKIGPLDGFLSKMGRPFSAPLKFNKEEFKIEFDFGEKPETQKEIDFTGQTPLGKCPVCGGNVYETDSAYLCENNIQPKDAKSKTKKCTFRTGKVILGQAVSVEQLRKLLTTGKTDLLTEFFSERKQKKFSAYLVVDKKKGTGFEFEPRAPKSADEKKERTARPKKVYDFSNLKPLAKCPVCGGDIYETEDQYICETATKGRKCSFRTGKVILKQKITHDQLNKLITNGRTDLLTDFVSTKTNKKFSAYLVRDEKGHTDFEFES